MNKNLKVVLFLLGKRSNKNKINEWNQKTLFCGHKQRNRKSRISLKKGCKFRRGERRSNRPNREGKHLTHWATSASLWTWCMEPEIVVVTCNWFNIFMHVVYEYHTVEITFSIKVIGTYTKWSIQGKCISVFGAADCLALLHFSHLGAHGVLPNVAILSSETILPMGWKGCKGGAWTESFSLHGLTGCHPRGPLVWCHVRNVVEFSIEAHVNLFDVAWLHWIRGVKGWAWHALFDWEYIE